MAPNSPGVQQMLTYFTLLEKWNARINLTADTKWQALEPLFREGILVSRLYPPSAINHLDIGTGAGFPAIILRILLPRIHLELVESRSKKCVFLETVVHILSITGTKVYSKRLDSFLQHCTIDKVWDCITWKGLKINGADLLQILKYTHAKTQFWMFHGKEPAIEDASILSSHFSLIQRKKLPGKKEWRLSIYLPRR